MNKADGKVSIIIVVHNAFKFCRILFNSLRITAKVDYEIIVVDNNSKIITKVYLWLLFISGRITRICYLNTNVFYSAGNNIGASIASRDSSHILLLNSDVKILDSLWLYNLLDIHTRGITSYGVVGKYEGIPVRSDGFCLLIDRDLFSKYSLDETYKFWWSLTKLEAQLLRDGYAVKAVKKYENYLIHYMGKSGDVPKEYLTLRDKDRKEWSEWYKVNNVQIV